MTWHAVPILRYCSMYSSRGVSQMGESVGNIWMIFPSTIYIYILRVIHDKN